MYSRSAKLLLVDVLAHTRADHWRTGHEELRRAFNQDRQVRRAEPGGTEAVDRAEPGRDHRNHRQVVHDVIPAWVDGYVGVPGSFQGLHAAAPARALDQPDDRQVQLVRELLGVDLLADDRGISRAAANGEVVTADDYLAAVQAPGSGHEIGRHEAGELAGLVISSGSGERPDLVK